MRADSEVALKFRSSVERICWNRFKRFRYEGSERIHSGYDLELAGTCTSSRSFGPIGVEEYLPIVRTLFAVAGWAMNCEKGPCEFEALLRPNRITFWSRHQSRPDVILSISVLHRNHQVDESDGAAHACIEAIGHRLSSIGVYEG